MNINSFNRNRCLYNALLIQRIPFITIMIERERGRERAWNEERKLLFWSHICFLTESISSYLFHIYKKASERLWKKRRKKGNFCRLFIITRISLFSLALFYWKIIKWMRRTIRHKILIEWKCFNCSIIIYIAYQTHIDDLIRLWIFLINKLR